MVPRRQPESSNELWQKAGATDYRPGAHIEEDIQSNIQYYVDKSIKNQGTALRRFQA